jgi:indoleamine 2,3-dioxygenase
MLSTNTPPSHLPRLQDYDIDPHNGFLPATPPLSILPDSYYQPWEDIISNFNSFLLTGQLREMVLKVTLFPTYYYYSNQL